MLGTLEIWGKTIYYDYIRNLGKNLIILKIIMIISWTS